MVSLDLLVPALLLAIFAIAGIAYAILRLRGRAAKPFLLWTIGPVERLLVHRVSPHVVTAMSLLFCITTAVLVGVGDLTAAVWLYGLAGILEVLDGRLAHLGGRSTATAALDAISDTWGELLVLGGYAYFLRDSPWLLAAGGAFGGSMIENYTRARAEGLGITLPPNVHRAERIVVVTLGTLIAAYYGEDPRTVDHVVPIVGVTMVVCGVMSIATAIYRGVDAYRVLARGLERRSREDQDDRQERAALEPIPRKNVTAHPRRHHA